MNARMKVYLNTKITLTVLYCVKYTYNTKVYKKNNKSNKIYI